MSQGRLVIHIRQIQSKLVRADQYVLLTRSQARPVLQYGRQGPPGPPGPAGSGGTQFIQSAPAAVWTVNHNLGHYVNAKVYSAGGVEMWSEIIQPNTNQLLIYFDGPQTGYVIY
jgi:hypothetical protein